MQDLGKITIDVKESGGAGTPSSGVGGYVPPRFPMVQASQVPSIFQSGGMGGTGGQIVQAGQLVRDIVQTGTNFRGQVELIGSRFTASAGTMGTTMLTAAVGIGIAGVAVGAAVVAVKAATAAFNALKQFVDGFIMDIRDYSPAIQAAEMQNEIAMTMTRFRVGALGGEFTSQIQQQGRVERSLVQISGYAAAIGSKFLTPILKATADILDAVVTNLPKITETVADVISQVAAFIKNVLPTLVTSMNPLVGIAGTSMFQGLGIVLEQIAGNVRKIERNTSPAENLTELNKPFMDDIRLMTGRAI
jgi:hypothetical protein